MMLKTLAAVGLFAAIGAAVGYSKILCAGGECAMTGTPYGGAFFGGLLGFAIMAGVNTQSQNQSPTSEPGDEDAGTGADTDDTDAPK